MSDEIPADARAEIYGTAPASFTSGSVERLHPVVHGVQLTELEQDVEAELRRRGFKHSDVDRTNRWSLRCGEWAVKRVGYVPSAEHLNMTIEQIADAIEEKIK